MDLSNCSVYFSVIHNADDPEKLGRVQAVIPGETDNATMPDEAIPWCMPLVMSGSQSFSRPLKGQKVLVLHNRANYDEFWYMPFYEYNNISNEYIKENYDSNPELLVCRNNGGSKTMISVDDKNGLNLEVNNNGMKVEPDGTTKIKGGSGVIEVRGGKVHAGSSDGSYELGVKGETLHKMLNNLSGKLKEAAMAAQKDYHTFPMFDPLSQCAQVIDDMVDSVLAENFKVN